MSQNPEANQKNEALFLQQKALLDTFLAHQTIDRRQYDKSLNCLREKLGVAPDHKNTN